MVCGSCCWFPLLHHHWCCSPPVPLCRCCYQRGREGRGWLMLLPPRREGAFKRTSRHGKGGARACIRGGRGRWCASTVAEGGGEGSRQVKGLLRIWSWFRRVKALLGERVARLSLSVSPPPLEGWGGGRRGRMRPRVACFAALGCHDY